MHILVLGGSPDHLGGVEAFCERSMEALAERNGWRMARIPTATAFLTVKRIPVLLRGLASLVRYRAKRPDCVWLQYSNLPDLSFLVVAKLLGFKVMVTPHLGSNWRSQSKAVLRDLSCWMLGFADRLALISKTQELEIKLPTDVPRSFIRNFLPATLLAVQPPAAGLAPDRLQLIHSGRLSEGKGTFLFVEVCARLKAAGVPFFARITGGADEATYARLNSMILEHGLIDQVAVLGRVSEEALLEHLRGSDVLVHLSSIDSYPLIVLEAMTCSMLPVCMELAGARDMIETYDGHVVSVANAVEETAAFLTKLDLEDARRRGQAASLMVRNDYSWAKCAGALEAALQACVTKKAVSKAGVAS
jgi:glycosyltransferase involved in cell wall biosynthesis